jgi:hypothetical protein
MANGDYIYMAMSMCNGHRVCIAVAYNLDYCVKKALQFEQASGGLVSLEKVNKVKTGQTVAEDSFSRDALADEIEIAQEIINGNA